ncbi:MAG: GNAT family N-acetyltransferase [Nitrospirota bacterium]
MKFLPTSLLGTAAWDEFCRQSDDAGFRHTSTWIDYTLHMRGPGGSTDLSFGVMDEGKLVAVAPLIKERIHQRPELFEFGFAGWNIPYPALINGLGDRHREKMTKEIFQEIDRLARQEVIAYAAVEVNPLLSLRDDPPHLCNPLPFLGFHATEIATHIIGLDRDEDSLLRDMRKGHKSDITAARNNGLSGRVFDAASITDDAFAAYRRLHLRAAGRQTRPDRTWELMHEWIKSGFAVLGIVSGRSGAPLAAALCLTYKHAAYYGSSCVDPEFANERGAMHLLLWEVMVHLKAAGLQWFETGWQHTPTMSQEVPSKKEVAISHFKRGFGGRNVPYFRGERFYDPEYLREISGHRVQKWIEEWGVE